MWRSNSSLGALPLRAIRHCHPFTKHCQELWLMRQDLAYLRLTSLSFTVISNFNKNQEIWKTASRSPQARDKSKYKASCTSSIKKLRRPWLGQVRAVWIEDSRSLEAKRFVLGKHRGKYWEVLAKRPNEGEEIEGCENLYSIKPLAIPDFWKTWNLGKGLFQ